MRAYESTGDGTQKHRKRRCLRKNKNREKTSAHVCYATADTRGLPSAPPMRREASPNRCEQTKKKYTTCRHRSGPYGVIYSFSSTNGQIKAIKHARQSRIRRLFFLPRRRRLRKRVAECAASRRRCAVMIFKRDAPVTRGRVEHRCAMRTTTCTRRPFSNSLRNSTTRKCTMRATFD